jgi:hypothetical protein
MGHLHLRLAFEGLNFGSMIEDDAELGLVFPQLGLGQSEAGETSKVGDIYFNWHDLGVYEDDTNTPQRVSAEVIENFEKGIVGPRKIVDPNRLPRLVGQIGLTRTEVGSRDATAGELCDIGPALLRLDLGRTGPSQR